MSTLSNIITAPNIITPHNNLFIQTLSRKEKAIALFEKCLSEDILKLVDLNKIELVNSQHMSDAGLSLYNDIVYRCPLGKDGELGDLVIMCEHQSTRDRNMLTRLFKYIIAIIETYSKQRNKYFPIVVPIVVHTGKSPWNYSTAFSDYYANPSLGSQFLSMAPVKLIELPKNAEAEIYRDAKLGFLFTAFYCGRTKDAYIEFEKFKKIPAFRKYFDNLPADERLLVGRYIGLCVNRKKYSLEKIVNLVIISEHEKEKFMNSVAQEYIDLGIQKGVQQGIKQGVQQGVKEVAKNMLLQLHLDIATVQKATKLTKEEIQKLLKDVQSN